MNTQTPERFVVAGFEAMTQQEIFDTAVAHIAKTRTKSVSDRKACVYSGTGCNAAPFIIPERRLAADSAGEWDRLVVHGHAPKEHHTFMVFLQRAHDFAYNSYAFMSLWKVEMRNLALQFGLDASKLEAVPE